MKQENTALIMIGYQNDYFAPDGILHGVIEEASRVNGTLRNTIRLLEHVVPTSVLLVSTPIMFTPEYEELAEPVGILSTIKEVGAFRTGTPGAETIAEIRRIGDRIVEVPGKRGLNAFSNTDLSKILDANGIRNVAICGVVTSICIDSTGRAAHERGYGVKILGDCTSGRTVFEQKFYCDNIFPLYAEVLTHRQFLEEIGVPATLSSVSETVSARA